MVPAVVSLGLKRGRGVTLTTHVHLVPRSKISRSYTSSPPCAIMTCSVTAFFSKQLMDKRTVWFSLKTYTSLAGQKISCFCRTLTFIAVFGSVTELAESTPHLLTMFLTLKVLCSIAGQEAGCAMSFRGFTQLLQAETKAIRFVLKYTTLIRFNVALSSSFRANLPFEGTPYEYPVYLRKHRQTQ
jgi:hypothetical protein